MSENIQSISQGTYTIGSTSATNFQAGPGISITQPAEGTVRIANDETVLYSGDGIISGRIALSEPWSNFNKLQIDVALINGWTTAARPQTTNLITTEVYTNLMADLSNTWRTSNGTVSIRTIQVEGISGQNSLTVGNNYIVQITSNGTVTNTTSDQLGVFRIVGINRISGSNA